MGSTFSFQSLFGGHKYETNILMVGLEGAGKTSILRKLNLGEINSTMPKIGFHCESVIFKNTSITSWDLSRDGLDAERRKSLQNKQCIIFVVDSTNTGQLDKNERLRDWSTDVERFISTDRVFTEEERMASNEKIKDYYANFQLNALLKEEALRDATLLVFATKQDLPLALRVSEITEKLGLETLVPVWGEGRRWHVQACSAVTGDGLREGLNWLINTTDDMKNVSENRK